MSWRFRKTFKVLPGVKLNLTARGLSATLGAAPFSVNIGPKGVYRNVSIPGTGIWDRQRIGGPSQPSGVEPPSADDGSGVPSVPSVPPAIPVSPSPSTQIHSASTELLTSESLEHLRRLITDAYNERDELTKDISSATLESNTAARRYQNWERGFLMRRLFKQSFTTRKEDAATAVAKLEELQEQLRLTTIATEITVDPEQAASYYRMRDEFAALSGCQKVWNVLTEKTIDRIAQRSTAHTAVTRNPVSFLLDSCDLIQWEQKVPHLQNHTGGDMYVYPGFILYRPSRQAFALITFHNVSLKFVSTQFTEADTVPSDTHVIGQTWAKSNKDGSRDRRFQGNYQIPVVHYGSLLFTSSDGLDVRYLCSNAALAERFAKAWTAFRVSFSAEMGDPAQARQGQRNITDVLERFHTAQVEFQSAQQAFSKNLMSIASTEEGKGGIRTEDFIAYMASVVELISTAKGCVEIPNLSQVSTARARFQSAIERFEAVRTDFEKAVAETLMDSDHLRVYYDELAKFLDAIAQFGDTLAGGRTKVRRGGHAK
jgi:hypothetical protein